MTQSISVSTSAEVAGLDGGQGAVPQVEDPLACSGSLAPSRATNSTAFA